jgi:hypothetical protein
MTDTAGKKVGTRGIPRRGSRTSGRRHDRGQLSLSVIEAGIGVLLVLTIVLAFALGLPAAETRESQLTAYAADATGVLAGEPPRHGGGNRLSEVARSESTFLRERAALERRVGEILPENLFFQIETPHGTVGYRKPSGVAVGESTVTTINGDVTVRVWFG